MSSRAWNVVTTSKPWSTRVFLLQVYQKHSLETPDAHAGHLHVDSDASSSVPSDEEDTLFIAPPPPTTAEHDDGHPVVVHSHAGGVSHRSSGALPPKSGSRNTRHTPSPATVGPSGSRAQLRQVELAAFMLASYGVVTALGLWPALVALHVSGVEPVVLPGGETLVLLCYNAVLDSANQGFLLVGILATSPLFMAVGSMMVRHAPPRSCPRFPVSALVLGVRTYFFRVVSAVAVCL